VGPGRSRNDEWESVGWVGWVRIHLGHVLVIQSLSKFDLQIVYHDKLSQVSPKRRVRVSPREVLVLVVMGVSWDGMVCWRDS